MPFKTDEQSGSRVTNFAKNGSGSPVFCRCATTRMRSAAWPSASRSSGDAGRCRRRNDRRVRGAVRDGGADGQRLRGGDPRPAADGRLRAPGRRTSRERQVAYWEAEGEKTPYHAGQEGSRSGRARRGRHGESQGTRARGRLAERKEASPKTEDKPAAKKKTIPRTVIPTSISTSFWMVTNDEEQRENQADRTGKPAFDPRAV